MELTNGNSLHVACKHRQICKRARPLILKQINKIHDLKRHVKFTSHTHTHSNTFCDWQFRDAHITYLIFITVLPQDIITLFIKAPRLDAPNITFFFYCFTLMATIYNFNCALIFDVDYNDLIYLWFNF